MTDVVSAGAARYTGARIHRVEDARLVTGRGTYVDDIVLPGMLHAFFVRSPFLVLPWAASTFRPRSPSRACAPS